MTDNTKETCLTTGHCAMHDVEVERRANDHNDIALLKEAMVELNRSNEKKIVAIHSRTNTTENRVMGIFVSLGLMAVIVFGCYYFTNIVNTRNDRGEEILLAKINADYKSAKEERTYIVAQVVELLTASAEQKEWQRGMITQLELLNTHIHNIVELKYGDESANR